MLKPGRKWSAAQVVCLIVGILQVACVVTSLLLEALDIPLSSPWWARLPNA